MPNTAAPKILLVDDDLTILRMLSISLTKAGYEVITANGGQQAIEVACEALPDLVVLDVMMPGTSGWEVVQTLRKNPATAKIKLVVLTAAGAKMTEATSALYGVDAHINKPFEHDHLRETIRSLLE